jgi:hypothetical protein
MPTEHDPICILPQPTSQRFREETIGFKIGGRGTKTTVIAYADDVTIVVSKPEEMPIVLDTLKIYERATGPKN